MSRLLTLYHRLPYPVKVLAASARGWQLQRFRYSPDTDRLVAEALEREAWSPQQWASYQEERKARVLHDAAMHVPFYCELWQARRRQGDRASTERLENWPVLEKDTIKANPHAFRDERVRPGDLMEEHTSGTTGKPLTIWTSRASARTWYALTEARMRVWNGLSRHDPWAILGGRMVAPAGRERPPFWVWNAAGHQLYLSAYHLAPQHAAAYLEAMRRYELSYLYGYASAMASLAQLALEQGLTAPPLRCAFSNAETLIPAQRETIQAAFGAQVLDTYGMAEQVAGASECSAGSLHLWPEVGVVEVLEDDAGEPAGQGVPGRLICTSLINSAMPLIRYQIGDRAALGPEEGCACGRRLPLLASVEGRMDDVVITRDGRRIGRLGPVFKADLPVREAQIIQETLERFTFKVVPAPGYNEAAGKELADRLRERVGNVQVEVQVVESIPRTATGKFRVVVSKVKAGGD